MTFPPLSQRLGSIEAQREFMSLYGEQVEQLLSIGIYLIPVRDDGEGLVGMGSQTLSSIIDLFTTYRVVLLRSPDSIPVVDPQLRSRYTVLACSVRSTKALQMLVEMWMLKAGGAQNALVACFSIESVKLALKFAIQRNMPFPFYIDDDALQTVESPSPMAAMDSEHMQVTPAFERILARSRRVAQTPRFVIADLLFQFRPLCHVATMLRHGPRSLNAWLVAFVMDTVGYCLLELEVRKRRKSFGPERMRYAVLANAELQRRRLLLLWTLARSPFFERTLQRPFQAIDNFMKRIPVLNAFNVMELFLAFQPFYFYTSGT